MIHVDDHSWRSRKLLLPPTVGTRLCPTIAIATHNRSLTGLRKYEPDLLHFSMGHKTRVKKRKADNFVVKVLIFILPRLLLKVQLIEDNARIINRFISAQKKTIKSKDDQHTKK